MRLKNNVFDVDILPLPDLCDSAYGFESLHIDIAAVHHSNQRIDYPPPILLLADLVDLFDDGAVYHFADGLVVDDVLADVFDVFAVLVN